MTSEEYQRMESKIAAGNWTLEDTQQLEQKASELRDCVDRVKRLLDLVLLNSSLEL
jgi:hypothetical protein